VAPCTRLHAPFTGKVETDGDSLGSDSTPASRTRQSACLAESHQTALQPDGASVYSM